MRWGGGRLGTLLPFRGEMSGARKGLQGGQEGVRSGGRGGCRFLIGVVDCIAELAWRLQHYRCRLGRAEEPQM